MYNFKYVTVKQLSPVKQDLIVIINSVQDLIRKDFTFRFDFVGSVERNMVTYDVKSNIGFDFDVNIQVNDDECNFSAEDIKTKIKNALDKVAPHFGYDYAEDSTRVLTIKVKDRKKQKNYTWEEQPRGYYLLPEKEEWIKNNGYWDEMRKLYLDKKNCNNDSNKHSRSIYAETIHQICQRYGYYN